MTEFRQSDLVCLMETWLKDHHETSSLVGYTTKTGTRTVHENPSEDNSWATQYCIWKQVCTLDYEIDRVKMKSIPT